jgi:acetolactate synthase regulatory subunit
MKLYTIIGTPVRQENTDTVNDLAVNSYPQVVAKTLGQYRINGFTIYKVNGYWQGTPETSFKIEVAVDDDDANYIKDICKGLRDLYNQDCVMLTNPDNTVEFI